MCHSPEDQPRIRNIGGAAADHGAVFLISGDGTKVAAYFARAAKASGSGIVVLPDAGGLSDFYRELTERFAEAGIDAVAIDYYARTAGTGSRPEGFNADQHMAMTRPETVDADAAAAAAFLRSKEGGAVKSLFAVGFCFGGANSWRQARHGLDGAIGFYGSGVALRESVPDLRVLRSPLLLLVAAADPYFPLADSQLIDRELEAAGVPHATVVYDGAPHGFFSSGDWQDTCDDAWRQTLRFIEHNSATTVPTC